MGGDPNVYVFEKQTGEDWVQTAQIPVTSLSSGYTYKAVSIYNDYLLVGISESGTLNGKAKIYEFNGSNWVFSCTLDNDINFSNPSGWFGESVSIYGRQAVVGAPYDDDNGLVSGSVFSYFRDDYGNWNFVQKITPLNGDENYLFGYSCDISNPHLIVGQPQYLEPSLKGTAYCYPNFVSPCDRIFERIIYQPDPGTYPDILAGIVSLGGNPPDQVTLQSGVVQHYFGGAITLLPGFTASYGSDFRAKGIDCSFIGSKDNFIAPAPVSQLVDTIVTSMPIEPFSTLDNDINVFPNPVDDVITIKSTKEKILGITLYDLRGTVLFKETELKMFTNRVDFSGFAHGMYYLKVKTFEGERLFKVIH